MFVLVTLLALKTNKQMFVKCLLCVLKSVTRVTSLWFQPSELCLIPFVFFSKRGIGSSKYSVNHVMINIAYDCNDYLINTLTSAFLFVSKHIKLFQVSIEIKILLDGTIE